MVMVPKLNVFCGGAFIGTADHDTQYVVLIVFARAKKYARNSVVYSFYWEKERKNSTYGYITPWIEGGTFLQFV